MAGSPPSDDAIKQRIIRHMNADHRDSVVRYVENYCGATRFAARNAQMTEITLSAMTIVSGSNTYTVPFEPPLSSLSEARPRVIKMDVDSIKALGRSDITIKEYRVPEGFGAVVAIVVFLTFILLSRDEFSRPGSPVYDNLLKYSPSFAALVQRVRIPVLIAMIAIHGVETYILIGKLEQHSTPLFSRVWWSWVVTHFFEGITDFMRFDALVAEKRKAKEASKH